MSTLTEFLLARIAEDEAVARATSGQPWSATVPGMVHADGGFRIKSRYVASVEHDEDRAHIVRWDPARVLAECDAERRIVVRCQEMLTAAVPMAVHLAQQTLADLARPYAEATR